MKKLNSLLIQNDKLEAIFLYLQAKLQRSEIIIVITHYSLSCLGQETAKVPFGVLLVKLPPAHLSTTRGRGFTLSL